VLPPWWRPASLLAQSSQSHGKTPAAMQLHCYHTTLTLAADRVYKDAAHDVKGIVVYVALY